MEAETTSSVTLCWEAPEGPDLQNCTYWVQWIGDGNKTETQSTTNTSVTMEGLELGTLYKFSVWAEENGVPGSRQNLSISTGERHQCPCYLGERLRTGRDGASSRLWALILVRPSHPESTGEL